ncbi:heterokaryon incompatibility protein-domain-containing protein [Annulohypoxylon nitens]|nr:heterokaryon incompatibility protein-domain-containing protein [Annulohypoxylon nitens]
MWLLHASSKTIEYFIDDDYPPYAILSHTWEEEEVSFQDWQGTKSPKLERMKVYQKILYCCTQALRDGLEWVWVDTCCIDKTSSAELSESINSMFRWYQNSTFCYAYLSDVSRDTSLTPNSEFARSRWHSRGWTLQELIAPKILFFFSKDWCLLGTKSRLSELLHSITHIEPKFLDRSNLDLASVAKKMSWASNRNTSRVEDIAYCLLGIFDINMPLIYGEGKNAFRRLQEEIIKTRFDDHSVFAWGTIVPKPSIEISNKNVLDGIEDLAWSKPRELLGLLAESPRYFADSGMFIPSPIADEFYRNPNSVATLPVLAGSEIRIQLPVSFNFDSIYHWGLPEVSQVREGIIVVLLCCHEKHPNWLLRIPLQSSVHRSYGRTNEVLFDESLHIADNVNDPLRDVRLLYIAPEKRRVLRCGDIIIQRITFNRTSINYTTFRSRPDVTYFESERLVTMNSGRASETPLITFSYKLRLKGENFNLMVSLNECLEKDKSSSTDPKSYISIVSRVSNEPKNAAGYHEVRWLEYLKLGKALNPCPYFHSNFRVERKVIGGSSFVDVVDIDVSAREVSGLPVEAGRYVGRH